jgi:hypothetical protein
MARDQIQTRAATEGRPYSTFGSSLSSFDLDLQQIEYGAAAGLFVCFDG